MSNPDDDVCEMCKQTRAWHRDNAVRHPFTPPGTVGRLVDTTSDEEAPQTQPEATKRDRGIRPMRAPFDPVLRQALMDAGVITIDQLEQAERKIRFLSEGISEGVKRDG